MKRIHESGIALLGALVLLLLVLGLAYASTSWFSAKQKYQSQTLALNANAANSVTQNNSGKKDRGKIKADPSLWQTQLRQKAFNALADSNDDLLIVPFQSSKDNHEFDETTRSLLTLTNARTLGSTELNITNTVLVAEALGLNKSRYHKNEIAKIATQTGASSVLLSYIDHDNSGSLNIRLELYRRKTSSAESGATQAETKNSWNNFEAIVTTSRDNISFDSSRIPYFVYQEIHHELLHELFDIEFRETAVPPQQFNISLDSSVKEFLNSAPGNPLATARKLQFLALLHPAESTERSGPWLNERSLIELDKLEPTAEVDFLKASALIALNRRPAALELLQDLANSPEKSALLDYSNGNITSKDKLATITDVVDRLSANIRNHRLRSAYWLENDETVYEELDGLDFWRHLTFNALQEGDIWRTTDNSYLKSLLDHILPDKQLSFGNIMTRLSLTPSSRSATAMEQAILDHTEKVENTRIQNDSGVTVADLLHLVRAQMVENIYDRIYLETHTRGVPEVADEYIRMFEPLIGGQPDFSLIASQTYEELGSTDNTPTHQIDKYKDKASQYAVSGFTHANNHNKRTRNTHTYLNTEILSGPQQKRLLGKTQWPATCQPRAQQFEECLENTIGDFHTLIKATKHYQKNDVAKANQLLAENHHRFKGNELRLDYLNTTYQQLDNQKGIDLVEQELANSDNVDWKVLKRMSDTARLQSRFDDAADLILRYPEFADNKNINNLTVSNRSYRIASSMYWAGAHKAATRLFATTVSKNTGAESEIAARARLATIQGDLLEAANHQYERIKRYQSSFAMRDLMGLLAIISGGEEALQLAHSLTPFMTKPPVWHGNLFAHRANGSNNQEQAEWLDSILSEKSNPAMSGDWEQQQKMKRYANNYLLMTAFLDRPINEKSTQYIADNIKRERRALMLANNASEKWIAFPESPPLERPTAWFEKTFRPPQLTSAQVMKSLYAGDFKTAEQLLSDNKLCHGFHQTDEYLWLCAWTASHTDRGPSLAADIEAKTEEINQEMLMHSDPGGRLFDNSLALAMLYGFDERHDEALDLLYLANADHRFTNERGLLVRYHLLEVARILFEGTKEVRYKSLVLELARNYTITDPIAAYNHSFIAMLSDDRDERISSLIMLVHLDPESRAITLANAEELREARKQAENSRSAVTQYEGNEI